MTISAASTQRYLRTPRDFVRKGCPRQLVPSYQKRSLPDGERRQVIHEYTTMMLTHLSKQRVVKNQLDLTLLHRELELDSLHLQASGASNILVSKVSFNCLITTASGEQIRDYIHFDLRIPGTNTDKEAVLSYEMLINAYGGKDKLYSAMKSLYTFGKKMASNGHKHGHTPLFDPTSSRHDQYIRHTEQFLVAYLTLPEAAEMLRNRLKVEIRSKYAGAIHSKVYNMGLHMHSTKTCCGPCEYSLVGLMNQYKQFSPNFLKNFIHACLEPNEQLTITLPKKSNFQLLTTVTTSENCDGTHKKKPDSDIKVLECEDSVTRFMINVKDPQASKKIYISAFNCGFDRRRIPEDSSLRDKTVVISGSRTTKAKGMNGSGGTIHTVKQVRAEELDEISSRISSLEKYL
ncbi:MAG: hypothetical protein WAM28_06030 [Chlamydiales bacterium]